MTSETIDIDNQTEPEAHGDIGNPTEPEAHVGIEFAPAQTRFIVLSLLILLVIRIFGMFTFPFIDTTEARYAEIARLMVETNDWITPQFNYGVPFWGKPPLHTWLSAGGMEIFGVTQFGARSLIFATALVLLVLFYFWVKKAAGKATALLSLAVLSSCFWFYASAAFVMTDMAMTLGTSLSMIAFWNVVTRAEKSPIWGHLVFVGLAIGLMAKGPVAVVIVGIALFLWCLSGNRWRVLARFPWLTGMLLLVVLVLPWYLAAEYKTPGFLHYFIIGEHYERFVVPGWKGDLYGSGHARPKGMIWAYWLMAFLPWSLILIGPLMRPKALLGALRKDQTGLRSYLFFWTIAPMILFTPAANILPAYVLPGLPAAAFLVVLFWNDAFGDVWKKSYHRIFSVGIWATIIIFFIYLGLAIIIPDKIRLKTQKGVVDYMKNDVKVPTVYYLGNRVYSAEFYSAGKVVFLPTLDDVKKLTENTVQDAIAISPASQAAFEAAYGTQFTYVKISGRYRVYLENKPGGAN